MMKSLNLRQPSLTLVNRKFDVPLFVRLIVFISYFVFRHHLFISASDLPMLNFLTSTFKKPGFGHLSGGHDPVIMATVNAVVERGCTMLVHYDKSVSSTEIKEALESGSAHEKAEAMKKAIAILLSGEQMPQIFITIVRFVLPSEDKYVQKLLLLYMEIIEKTDAQGKLLPEMILICQNLRNNLQHPNEFLRGATLRFLCRIQEGEILEPLIPSIIACLEHRHSFVRRNAVMCMDRIYQMPGGDMLLMDAPETIERFLQGGESDLGTRRNAFLMLYNNAQERAVNFLMANLEQVANWGDILQNVVLDLIRKVRVVFTLFRSILIPERPKRVFQPVPSREGPIPNPFGG